MEYRKSFSLLVFQLLHIAFLLASNVNGEGLKLGFYKKTCPTVEAIVQKTTEDKISVAPSLAAALLRMYFHDCFVQGCDGSVLIDSTQNNKPEKDGPPNLSLRGFQVIDAEKTVVEAACPGVVSCANILALVFIRLNGHIGPCPWGGDGRVSKESESLGLPPFSADITKLKEMFASKGLSVKDLVVLSGGHTVGISHCPIIAARLYNFTGKDYTDPSLDLEYARHLKSKCKPTDMTTVIEMDPWSVRTFDKNYYTNVLKRRGLFQSDAALLDDYETSAYVKLQAQSHGSIFFKDFQESMVKMGQIDVKTGSDGEIRRQCNKINY